MARETLASLKAALHAAKVEAFEETNALKAKVAELEARLQLGRSKYAVLRTAYRQLRDGTAQVPPRVERPVAAEPRVWRWYDQHNVLWESTRVGGQTRSRKVAAEPAAPAPADEQAEAEASAAQQAEAELAPF